MRHRPISKTLAPAKAAPLLTLLALLPVIAAIAAAGCKHHQPPGAAAAGASTGTGTSAPTGAPATANHACELLTGDDAEQLLGGAVKPPVISLTADIGVVSSRCGYISASTTPVKVVILLARKYQQSADTRSAYERAHAISQTVSGQVPETVPGLGDRAYWAGGTVNQLNVLAGDTWLVISGTSGPGLDQLGPAKQAAAKILAHR
jgi:hypothetical protein